MQTSIEMIIEEVKRLSNIHENRVPSVLLFETLFKAEEMHKQEIENTYWNAYKEGQYSGDKTAEEYYQKTFKKDMFMEIKFTNVGKKQSQKELIKEIMDLDAKDGLYEISDEEIYNAVVKEYENVGDEKLFPNHTDKDIWMNGFYEGAKWYREQLKKL
jgi:hypothetical protein